MKKYDLIDVVSRGTHARLDVKPNLIVAEGEYTKGDILDANSVENLIDTKIADMLGVESASSKDNDPATGAIADLADVANTGSYNDLVDKPTIPVTGDLGETVVQYAIYSYDSFDSTGEVQYGSGTVQLTGNKLTSGDDEYAEAEITADNNHPEFIGQKFYIENDADPDGETLYQLYDNTLTAVDLAVAITEVSPTTTRPRTIKEYVDYKIAQLANS